MKNVKVRVPPSSSPSEDGSLSQELRRLVVAPPKNSKLLSKQLSMLETSRDAAWEKRRNQMLLGATNDDEAGVFRSPRLTSRSLTDDDLDELKGSIELGFGFKEEDGQSLCDTLPALDLYFAVNRQISDSKLLSSASTPRGVLRETGGEVSFYSSGDPISDLNSPKIPNGSESWKLCSPGDNPKHVKTRLRHWAQAVACSVRQCC